MAYNDLFAIANAPTAASPLLAQVDTQHFQWLVRGFNRSGIVDLVSGTPLKGTAAGGNSVAVAAGGYTVAGKRFDYAGGSVTIANNASATQARLDVVYAHAGGVSVAQGTSAGQPVYPDPGVDHVAICGVLVPAGTGTPALTTANNLQDLRIPTMLGSSQAITVAASDAPQFMKDRADYVCDGVADQVEILAALARFAVSPATTFGITSGSGGRVLLSAGTFLCSDWIPNDNDGVSIEGLGWDVTTIKAVSVAGSGFATTAREALLKFRRDVTPYTTSPSNRYRPAYNIYLRGFSLNGNNLANAGHCLSLSCVWSAFENLRVYSSATHGVYQRGETNGDTGSGALQYTTYDTWWNNCMADHNGGCGWVFGAGDGDGHMVGCIAHTNTSHGVAFGLQGFTYQYGQPTTDYSEGATSYQIVNFHAYANSGAGIHHFRGGGTRNKISNSKFETNQSGIEIKSGNGAGASDVQITGSAFNNNAVTAGSHDQINMDGSIGGWIVSPMIQNCTFESAYNAGANPRSHINMSGSQIRQPVVANNLFVNTPNYLCILDGGAYLPQKYGNSGPAYFAPGGFSVPQTYNNTATSPIGNQTNATNITNVETAFTQIIPLPAKSLNVGMTFRITARGIYSSSATVTGFTLRLKIGTTIISMTNPTAGTVTPAASQTDQQWEMVVDVQVATMSYTPQTVATANVEALGMLRLLTSTATTNTHAGMRNNNATIGTTAVDALTAANVSLTVQFANTTNKASVQMRQLQADSIGA